MTSLGKLTAALLSGSNENNISALSINLDFSLARFDAPKEFKPLGSMLSLQRRSNAEEGPSHQVARRLGVLFAQVIPSTPNLIRAYGIRTSEIIQQPGVSPKGTQADGAFRDFVGADATSIWAAATSGVASIGVLLLGCMLARKFDDAKMSIAIWAELVATRQREIKEAEINNEVVLDSTMIAARQKISRDDLAIFDASVRAWLCSADGAKISEQKRLMLILRNIPSPVSSGLTTYAKVLSAWSGAMTGLECLLKGMPQQITDSAILLALSAWHLYPDLIVLSTEPKNVKFADPLFPEGALVTVGLQWTDEQDSQGIRWSLTLSHLRYYGDPINVDSRGDNTRVTMQQLRVVAFGSLLATWGIPSSMMTDAAAWFVALLRLLEATVQRTGLTNVWQYVWLRPLVDAASDLTLSCGEERATLEMLLAFGRRRGGQLLAGLHPQANVPFFGLCNPFNISFLSQEPGIEAGIHYLRDIAQSISLDSSDSVIAYRGTFNNVERLILATAVAHTRWSTKRSQGRIQNEAPNRKQEAMHARWLFDPSDSEGQEFRQGSRHASERAIDRERRRWLKYLITLRETAGFLPENSAEGLDATDSRTYTNGTQFDWKRPPLLYHHQNGSCRATESGILACMCFDTDPTEPTTAIGFVRLLGHPRQLALYVRRGCKWSHGELQIKVQEQRRLWLPPAAAIASLLDNALNPTQFLHYMEFIDKTTEEEPGLEWPAELNAVGNTGGSYADFAWGGTPADEFVLKLVSTKTSRSLLDSLEALSVASRIYRQFPLATIPLKITLQSIRVARWRLSEEYYNEPETGQGYHDDPEAHLLDRSPILPMNQAQTFALIAMFESGGTDIDPSLLKNVFALSSGNSLFVAGNLLTDPSNTLTTHDVRRIVGNIGFAGISFLVSPTVPRMKTLSLDYRAIQHADYDRKRENNFRGTSLHLAFTDFKVPLTSGFYGLIDQEIYIVEAVVSVRESGAWITDLDVFAPMTDATYIHGGDCRCTNPGPLPTQRLTAIDNWDELLDPPENVGVVRMHGNWAARLAAVCVLKQRGFQKQVALLERDKLCWSCLERKFQSAPKTLRFLVD